LIIRGSLRPWEPRTAGVSILSRVFSSSAETSIFPLSLRRGFGWCKNGRFKAQGKEEILEVTKFSSWWSSRSEWGKSGMSSSSEEKLTGWEDELLFYIGCLEKLFNIIYIRNSYC